MIFYFCDGIIYREEVLILEKSYCEVFGIVADGHLRYDFAAIEVDREGFFFDDGDGDGVVVVVGCDEGTGEGGIVGGWEEGGHGKSVAEIGECVGSQRSARGAWEFVGQKRKTSEP